MRAWGGAPARATHRAAGRPAWRCLLLSHWPSHPGGRSMAAGAWGVRGRGRPPLERDGRKAGSPFCAGTAAKAPTQLVCSSTRWRRAAAWRLVRAHAAAHRLAHRRRTASPSRRTVHAWRACVRRRPFLVRGRPGAGCERRAAGDHVQDVLPEHQDRQGGVQSQPCVRAWPCVRLQRRPRGGHEHAGRPCAPMPATTACAPHPALPTAQSPHWLHAPRPMRAHPRTRRRSCWSPGRA